MSKYNYDEILRTYPEFITKDQFYRICHVSKHTARFYLESGLVPAVNSGKKTRKYKIATKDVVEFLIKRDMNPQCYLAPEGWYKGRSGYKPKPKFVLYRLERNANIEENLINWLSDYPDLLKIYDVMKITGYSKKLVIEWCDNEILYHIVFGRILIIPKLSLIEFMLSENFQGIKVKTEVYKHFVENIGNFGSAVTSDVTLNPAVS